MRIKKYSGKTFQEALKSMKKDLGEDAIIINSKKVQESGSLDFLGTVERHEITACLDSSQLVAQSPADQVGNAVYKRPKQKLQPAGMESEYDSGELPQVLKGITEASSPTKPSIDEGVLFQQLSQIGDLKGEMKEMKKVLEQVADFIKYSRMPALPQVFKNNLKNLIENDVHEELAKAVMQTVYARTEPASYNNIKKVQANLFRLLEQMIKVSRPLEKFPRKPCVVTLVGPTGVGKTTTIAKIAANMKLFKERDVALISADTYRIAAIEQLQTFANIATIPMKVVYSPEEMQNALRQFLDKDIILIDTVGRSQKDDKQLEDLGKFIEAAEPDEIHLVLSLTSSFKTLMDVVNRFRHIRPNRLIFTKHDECTGAGAMLNVLYKHQIPISYVTTGQVVPNDLVVAEQKVLANLVYNGVLES